MQDFYGFWARGNNAALRALLSERHILWSARDGVVRPGKRLIDQRIARPVSNIVSWNQRVTQVDLMRVVTDNASYRVLVRGRIATIPVKVTMLWREEDGRTVLAHKHESYDLQENLIIADWARVAASSNGLPNYEKTQASADVIGMLVATLRGSEEDWDKLISEKTTVFFPGNGEGAIASRLRELNLSDPQIVYQYVDFSQGGRIAFCAVELRTTSASGGKVPLRISSFFVQQQKRWVLMHLHGSIPVRPGLVSQVLQLGR